MADISDARLEALLRTAMAAEEAALPVALRPEDILRRRSLSRRAAIKRNGMRLLVLAAALIVPVAALFSLSGRNGPTEAPASYRAVILRAPSFEPGAVVASDLEVLLADATGRAETVAVVPVSLYPEGVVPAADGWVTHSGTLGVSAYAGSAGAYATVDLHDLSARAQVSATDPRPVTDALPISTELVSRTGGELRVCRFTGPEYRRPCQERTDRAVESGAVEDGTLRAWLPRAESVRYEGVAWAADGGIWVLRDDRRGGVRALSFVHVAPDGSESSGGSIGLPAAQDLYLAGMAPDDSLAVVQLVDAEDITAVVIEPRTGAAVMAPGVLIGFADPTDATALPRAGLPVASLEPLADSLMPAYRPLESLEEQLAALSSRRVLLVHDGSSDGLPLDYDTGIVPYSDGWALAIECAGPGHLRAEIFDVAETDAYGGGLTDTECIYPTGSSFGGPGPDLPPDQPHQISATVHSEGQVAWRLVVVEVPIGSPTP